MNSTLLDGAADVIERNGWVQENFYEPAKGGDGKPLDPRACKVCPRGAIAVAAGRYPWWKATTVEFLGDADRADWDAIHAAERALVRHLDIVPAIPGITVGDAIERWADAPDRTLPQVLGALRAAAQAEREAGR